MLMRDRWGVVLAWSGVRGVVGLGRECWEGGVGSGLRSRSWGGGWLWWSLLGSLAVLQGGLDWMCG